MKLNYAMKFAGYCMSCYTGDEFVFSVLLRTNVAWLRKALKRKTHVINGEALTKRQFDSIRGKFIAGTEAPYQPNMEYFIQFRRSYSGKVPPRRTSFRVILPK
jgi:hypothetical protein